MDLAAKPLAGKAALVTGGSRGVGAATARLLADAGADVAINYRDKLKRAEGVAAQVEAAGSWALAVRADITDESAVDAMVAAIAERFGRLDLLILNASGGLEKDVAEDYACGSTATPRCWWSGRRCRSCRWAAG